MNFMSTLSLIMTIVCVVWLIALGIFVIVKKVVLKRKAKKEITNIEKLIEEELSKGTKITNKSKN